MTEQQVIDACRAKQLETDLSLDLVVHGFMAHDTFAVELRGFGVDASPFSAWRRFYDDSDTEELSEFLSRIP